MALLHRPFLRLGAVLATGALVFGGLQALALWLLIHFGPVGVWLP